MPPRGPRDGIIKLVIAKTLHLGLDEVLGQARGQAGELAVGCQRHPADLAVMIMHETDVAQQAPDVFPAGKLARVDHKALQRLMRFQPRVGRQRQDVEVLGPQGLADLDHDEPGPGNQTVGNNISQLQQNQGQAQASGVTGGANAVGRMFGSNGVGTSRRRAVVPKGSAVRSRFFPTRRLG